jgi:hypothetical protein
MRRPIVLGFLLQLLFPGATYPEIMLATAAVPVLALASMGDVAYTSLALFVLLCSRWPRCVGQGTLIRGL